MTPSTCCIELLAVTPYETVRRAQGIIVSDLTMSTTLATPSNTMTVTPMILLVHKELFIASLHRTRGPGNDWKVLKSNHKICMKAYTYTVGQAFSHCSHCCAQFMTDSQGCIKHSHNENLVIIGVWIMVLMRYDGSETSLNVDMMGSFRYISFY
jgi:hypothetical protein